ncbi:hypothetical protein KCMC57_up00910 [Kitasatospora sp. CMC57]|uniref:Uncharacterized protein n=1 Tax=Kitasatospora sp. CMC57 TaxID=3231513 RepID=A0AB33JTK3_9ACTN
MLHPVRVSPTGLRVCRSWSGHRDEAEPARWRCEQDVGPGRVVAPAFRHAEQGVKGSQVIGHGLVMPDAQGELLTVRHLHLLPRLVGRLRGDGREQFPGDEPDY